MTDEPTFKAGDRVRVTTSEWGEEQHGRIGTVDRIDEGDSLPVAVILDGKLDDGPYCYRHDQLESAGQERVPAPPAELKIGDAVVCIADGATDEFGLAGDTGTVFDPPRTNRLGEVLLGVVIARTGCRKHVFANRFKLDPNWQAGVPFEPTPAPVRHEQPSFNPGDLIRSANDASDDIAPGDTFTALLIEGGGEAPWLVTFNHPTSGSRTRFADRYERAEQP